jgi:hypothetical protein
MYGAAKAHGDPLDRPLDLKTVGSARPSVQTLTLDESPSWPTASSSSYSDWFALRA